jgi:hypothetical protein
MLSADQVWWERVRRAADRKGPVGSRLMADFCRDWLLVNAAGEERLELAGRWGHRTWQPVPPERCTDEYKDQETCRLCDELGVRLGVGPRP